ncbi:MAG TPA: type II toxin-antitoxin system HicB family antitoxin [Spirochaetales bacterium]|nr:type II toxin-antitoxin system HicB family antitoxin [Spirochaetales bacterium]
MKIPCKIIYNTDDSVWYVEAPDIYEGILTYGNSLEEAKEMAQDALSGLIATYMEGGKEIQVPSKREGPNWYDIELSPNVSFAVWLRSMRKKSGMTLIEAADRLGVKYQVYQKLENPETANPTLKTIAKIKKVFNIDTIEV